MKKFLCILVFNLCSLFVFSQMPYWYKSQLGTGLGNCGPACVAMVVNYYNNSNSTTVEQIRKYLGYKNENGATSLLELRETLFTYKIPYRNIDKKELSIKTNYIAIIGIYIQKLYNDDKVDARHYVIVQNHSRDYYLIQDPLHGYNKVINKNKVHDSLFTSEIIFIEGRK